MAEFLGNGREQTASAVSFLSELYSSVAETLPDFRDDTWDVTTSLVDASAADDKDSYASLLAKEIDSGGAMFEPSAKKNKKGKGSKVRKMRRSIQVNLERKPGSGGQHEERWLPPGQMKDQWELYKQRAKGVNSASFTTFWRAPLVSNFAKSFWFESSDQVFLTTMRLIGSCCCGGGGVVVTGCVCLIFDFPPVPVRYGCGNSRF